MQKPFGMPGHFSCVPLPQTLPSGAFAPGAAGALCRLIRTLTGAEAALIVLDGSPPLVTTDTAPALQQAAGALAAEAEAGAFRPATGESVTRGDSIAAGPFMALRHGPATVVACGLPPVERLAAGGLAAGGLATEGLALVAEAAAHQSDAMRRAAAVQSEAAFFRQIAEASTDTLVRGDLQGRRLYVSPSVRALLGYEPEELLGRKAIDIVHPEDRPAMERLIGRIRDGSLDQGMLDLRQQARDGTWVWMEALVRLTHDAATGVPDGYVASVRDIRRRKAAEQELARLATHDGLTGLPNRALLFARLEQAFGCIAGTAQGLAFLCIDIDRFKAINDGLGHQTGDAVLREVAGRFRAVLREEDTLARIGGDEFVVLLSASGHPQQAARGAAQRLIAALAAPMVVDGHALPVGVSIGIAIAHAGDAGASGGVALYRAADEALYRAKHSGRGCFSF